MFDIGFSEMLVIAVVALIVIGPERLPKVARTLGHLFGRMQRYVNDVKSDISREMELDELRKLQATVEDAARAIETGVKTEIAGTETELNKVAAAAAFPFAELQAPPAPASPEASPSAAPVAQPVAVAEPPALAAATAAAASVSPPDVIPAAGTSAATAAPQLELGLEPVQTPQPPRQQA